jgi:integrase
MKCPKLKRKDGSWNPKHGSWWFRLELERGPGGVRQTPLRRGGFASVTEAQEALDEAKEKVRRGINVTEKVLLGPQFDAWLKGKKKTRKNTNRGYESIGRVHIKPALGHIEVGKLRVDHVNTMFEDIDAENERIIAANEERARLRAVAKAAGRARDYETRRQALAQIAELPPWKRPTGPVTKQRVRDCLRNFLNACKAEGLVGVNVAALAELPEAKRAKPVVWTAERTAAWMSAYQARVAEERATANGSNVDLFKVWLCVDRPSTVMVWTPAQTGVFLDHAIKHRLYGAYHLMAFAALRRGETCGLAWTDVDLDNRALAVRTQLVQLGWKVEEGEPKTDASDATVALDEATVGVLRAHRKQQVAEQLAWSEAWVASGKVFTREDGSALHPATLTAQFERLAFEAGLPPIRLHDLRHGAATLALAAGVDMKVVSGMLRHSSQTITADTYTSILPDVAREAAEAVAAMVPRQAARAGGSGTAGHPRGTQPPKATKGRSPDSESSQVKQGGPERIRTSDTRFRNQSDAVPDGDDQ